VAHFFNHHPHNCLAVPVRGRGFKQVALLLNAGKLSVSLIDNQIHQARHAFAVSAPGAGSPTCDVFKGAKLDFFGLNGPVERVEL